MELDYFDLLSVPFVGYYRDLPSGQMVRRERLRMGLMTGGSVQKVTEHGTYEAQCPLLFFNFRSLEYCWRNRNGELRNSYFFEVTGPRAEQMEKMLQRDFPCGFVSCPDPAYFQLLLDKIQEAYLQPGTRKRILLPLYAEEFLAGIYTRKTSAASGNKYEKILLAHAELIREDPAKDHCIHSLAAGLSVTAVHYRRLFKSVMGMPPYEYLLECRLALGIQLLRDSKSLQIQEIAARCGFSSATEFSRFFKKHTSYSPVQYCKIFFE